MLFFGVVNKIIIPKKGHPPVNQADVFERIILINYITINLMRFEVADSLLQVMSQQIVEESGI